jgi:DNA-binding PadR family transcriptional regulator
VSEYAVLGLLGFGEKSGYELFRFAERSVGFIWTPAKSQIYKVLPRLADKGLARVRRVAQSKLPDRQLYRLTPAGRQVLRAWLARVDEAEPGEVMLLKIFFGGQVSGAVVARQVAAYREAGSRLLGDYRKLEVRLARTEANRLPLRVLALGVARAEADVAWAESLLRDLDRAGESA